MKLLLNKITTEKEKKNKNLGKIKQLEIGLIKLKYGINPNKLQSLLKELSKIHVVNKNLPEIKQEILGQYVGDFEMVVNLSVGDQIRETHIRFRNITDYEAYIFAIDQDYESGDAVFDDDIYKINTPLLNLVNRSQYGTGCDFNYEVLENWGNNCFIPTKG